VVELSQVTARYAVGMVTECHSARFGIVMTVTRRTQILLHMMLCRSVATDVSERQVP